MPTPEIYAKMSTEDLLALRQGRYDQVSSEGLRLVRGSGGAEFGKDADAGTVGTATSPRPYTGAPDAPLESPLIDPVDLIPGGLGAKAGAKAGSALASGPLRGLLRYRMGSNPGQGFEKVAEAVTRTAPAALQPAEATAEGLATVMRSGGGKQALQASRERGLGAIDQELAPVTQANRRAAGQGMTGPYRASAESAAADPAGRFKQLVQELADANAAGHSPVSGEVRGGMRRLEPLRDAAAIRSEIQGLLSPEQWKAFQALQNEYAKGSALTRLFKPKARGADVLHSQEALQTRAQTMQDKLDPAVLKAIFRGGKPLVRDQQASLPLGIGKFGRMNLPGTIMAGPPGNLQDLLLQILGGAGGAGAGIGVGRGLDQ